MRSDAAGTTPESAQAIAERRPAWAALAALTLAYSFAAVLGLQWAQVSGAGSPVWPAFGISLAALILGGVRLWPAIFVGRLAAGVITGSDHPLWTEIGIAGANAIADVVAVLLLLRLGGVDRRLSAISDVLRLVLAIALSAFTSATLGSATLRLSAGLTFDALGGVWLAWWFGNVVAGLTLTPLILTWGDPEIRRALLRRAGQLLLCLAMTGALATVVFDYEGEIYLRPWHLYPVLVWAALAFGTGGASAGLTVVSGVAIWSATTNVALPFFPDEADMAVRVFFAQQFVAVTAVTVLLLAAIADERRNREALAGSEARFRTLAATMPAFIFVTDEHGANVYTNTVFQQFTGKTGEELTGDGWLDTLHPDDRERAAATWGRAWQTGTAYEAEYRFHRQTDGYRWHLVRGTPIRNAEGVIVQWVGACIDMQDLVDARNALTTSNADLEVRVAERTLELSTALEQLQGEMIERKAAEAQVRQMQKMEAVGQLTGGIAHDFNNMLAIVIGSLDMAKRRVVTDPTRALAGIEQAEEGARRAAQLTARLLAFSRQSPLAPETIDANKLVGGMSEMLRRTIGEHVRVETVLAGGLWKTHADAAQLENALVNLCVNARDAMPDGGKLTVETSNTHLDDAYAAGQREVTPGQYVAVCVSDTGTGMPPDVVERAFDPFYTTKGHGKGTGLGLSQVYGFAKQSGGHVKIYSESGEGTTVKLYLPRYFGAVEVVERAPARAGELPRARAGEVILVVEDEDAVRHMSTDALRELGYTVVQASDANQALEVLAVQPKVDLLFTDIVMPDTNGRKLAEEALKRRGDLKVLFTTGYTRNAVVHNGMLDPGVAFLAKPFTIAALAAKVRAVLDGDGVNRKI